MAFIYDFKREDYNTFNDIPDGEYDVKVAAAAEPRTNRNGKNYLYIPLLVNTPTSVLEYELDIWEGEYFNKAMSRFCDCFAMPDGNVGAFLNYKGLRGRARFTHKEETFTGSDGQQKKVNKCVCTLIVPEKDKQQNAGMPGF